MSIRNQIINEVIGKRFTKLTVIKFVGRNKHSKKMYECRCDCGVIKTICIAELKNGDTKSCGCYADYYFYHFKTTKEISMFLAAEYGKAIV